MTTTGSQSLTEIAWAKGQRHGSREARLRSTVQEDRQQRECPKAAMFDRYNTLEVAYLLSYVVMHMNSSTTLDHTAHLCRKPSTSQRCRCSRAKRSMHRYSSPFKILTLTDPLPHRSNTTMLKTHRSEVTRPDQDLLQSAKMAKKTGKTLQTSS